MSLCSDRSPVSVSLDRVLAAELGMGQGGGPPQVSTVDQSFVACLHNTFGSTAEIRASPQLCLEALPQSLKPGAQKGHL